MRVNKQKKSVFFQKNLVNSKKSSTFARSFARNLLTSPRVGHKTDKK
jgi:hypothetical protein